MFNIGAGELFAIFVIALIFWGPNALPEIGRSLGRFVKSMRGFARQIRDELGPAAQELDELRSTVDEIRNPVAAFAREVADAPSRFDAMMRRKTEGAWGDDSGRKNAASAPTHVRTIPPTGGLTTQQSERPITLAPEDDYLSMLVERDYGRAGAGSDAPGFDAELGDASGIGSDTDDYLASAGGALKSSATGDANGSSDGDSTQGGAR